MMELAEKLMANAGLNRPRRLIVGMALIPTTGRT
jgi:hypothetical protein